MRPARLVFCLLVLSLAGCESGGERLPRPSHEQTPLNQRHVFPGGGQILFMPSSAPGYGGWRGIGIVQGDGTIQRFPTERFTFPYWDPARAGDILTLSFSPRPVARTFGLTGDRLTLLGKWRTSDGNFTYPSLDGRWLAYIPFDSRGHLETGVLRVVNRTTSKVRTIRSGTLVPLGWTPQGRIIAAPWAGGPAVLWDPRTGHRSPFLHGRRFELANIAWSPGGGLFAALANGQRWDRIVVGTAAGRIVHTVVLGGSFYGTPSWSPDGTRLAYAERGFGHHGERHSALHVYDLRSETDRVLTRNVSDVSSVSWSPDEQWLLVEDWTRDRWVFVSADGQRTVGYPWLGDFPRWCCPSSPPVSVQVPVS